MSFKDAWMWFGLGIAALCLLAYSGFFKSEREEFLDSCVAQRKGTEYAPTTDEARYQCMVLWRRLGGKN